MFYTCYEAYQASGRPSRFWVVEADTSPDTPDTDGDCAYPFNGMGGGVIGGFDSRDAAEQAIDDAIVVDAGGFTQWA